MKKMTLDRKNYPGVFNGCKNLSELIRWVETTGQQENMMVSKLTLNNRFLDEDEENLLSNLAISEVQSLDVEFRPLHELVAETMKSLIALLQDLQVRSLKEAEFALKTGGLESNAMKGVFASSRTLIRSLEEVFQLHNSGKFNLKHFSLWREAEKEFSGILQCLLKSIEIKDQVFVSELLAGAFPDALMHWEDVLEKEILDNVAVATIFNLNSGPSERHNRKDA